MGVKNIVFLEGLAPTVAFNVLTQVCFLNENEAEMAAALFTKNGEERNFKLLAHSTVLLYKGLSPYKAIEQNGYI